jgi:ElaB/YqjD/DUF883 family membrane-anchored ribosome-binding protein
MGQRTDQAERDVIAQRELITHRVDELRERVETDVDTVGARISAQGGELTDRAAEAADRVPGKQVIGDYVPAHPRVSVLGSFGVGIALGMLSHRSEDGHAQRSARRPEDRSQSDRGGGLFDGIAGAAMASMVGPIQEQLKEMVKVAIDGFLKHDSPARRETDVGPITPASTY